MPGHIGAIYAAGIPATLLIPCMPHNVMPDETEPGKTPCRLAVNGTWVNLRKWQMGVTVAELVAANNAGANCGLRMGMPADGRQFVFLDIDTEPNRDPDHPDSLIARAITENAIAQVRASLKLPALWVRLTRPGRAGILFEMPETSLAGSKFVAKMSGDPNDRFRGKLELLATGQQAVVAGIHAYGGGTPIRWYRTDRPEIIQPVPTLDEALPKITSRDQLDELLQDVIDLIRLLEGVRVLSRRGAGGTSEIELPLNEMAPPSAERLAAVLDDMPHDERIEREEYVRIMRCASGCIRALALSGGITDDDQELIISAAVRWAARWDDPKGAGTTEEQEREKWEADYARNPVTRLPCWDVIASRAVTLGNSELRLEQAQAEFEGIEPLPGAGLAVAVPPPPPHDPCAVASSEDALALEFSRRHAGQVVHIANGRGWHRWSGHVWALDERKAVFDLARLVCRDHARRLEDEENEALARRISSAATRSAVIAIAAADPGHARSIHEFDADPWILNTPGGVIDLRSGEMRPHRKGEPVAKSTPVAPGGDCPKWLRFLDEATEGDQGLVAYLQRWFGYSLTGSTAEQQFLFLYGPGGNGKSVIVQTLAAALGTYATSATPDVFTAVRSEQHLAHVAALNGARMVMAPETEEGKAWAESRLKSLVAADRQSARFMRGDPFEFTPILKLWICGNHLPKLVNVDDAMRRRTRILHLTHRPSTPDPFLQERLRSELGGILAWGIRGCLDWQRGGLGLPDQVQRACAEYFADQDGFTAWIVERLDQGAPNASESSRGLFADWREFARARGEDARTETWFGAEMQKRFVRRHTATGKRFFGVSLKPDFLGFEVAPSS